MLEVSSQVMEIVTCCRVTTGDDKSASPRLVVTFSGHLYLLVVTGRYVLVVTCRHWSSLFATYQEYFRQNVQNLSYLSPLCRHFVAWEVRGGQAPRGRSCQVSTCRHWSSLIVTWSSLVVTGRYSLVVTGRHRSSLLVVTSTFQIY